ncbi:hypothetical protein FRC04_002157 [Tulasnella sp. 424]|nr:hypothetical protein FRC04_002157 [Tulasnella sp. 424]
MSRSQTPRVTPGGYRFGFDQEVAFQIDGVTFGLPRSKVQASGFFRALLEIADKSSRGEGTQSNPINLNKFCKVTLPQVKAFHKILNDRRFEAIPELSEQQWIDALRLATLWDFECIRAYIIKNLKNTISDPLYCIQIADECDIKEWLRPAYARLCARRAPLTASEGQILGLERFAALARIREEALWARDSSLMDSGRQRQARGHSTASANHHRNSREESWDLSKEEQAFLWRIDGAQDLQ